MQRHIQHIIVALVLMLVSADGDINHENAANADNHIGRDTNRSQALLGCQLCKDPNLGASAS